MLRSPLDDVRRELDEYFEGTRREFDLPLDLRVAPFHADVLRELALVPYGRTDTYGALAAKVGRPRAARAVGTVMNRNPIPIVLPCHRIVGANGSLTGYAGGLDVKRRLLAARRRDAGLVQKVVVVGGGFGGLLAVRGLRRADVEVTLVDRQNFYLFQPLAYQVATGSLSSAEVAVPLRQILRRQRNATSSSARSTASTWKRRRVSVTGLPNGGTLTLDYDILVVAGGARYSYFGHDDWAAHAPELKSLEGALDLRDRILRAFEAAEVEQDEAARAEWLTFVVVGAGPTGVEMAGQIAELGKDVLHREYRAMDTRTTRVLLVEATGRVLGAFPPSFSASGERQLRSLGVTPLLETTVVGIDASRSRSRPRTGPARASRPAPWSGRRVSPPRRSPGCSPRRRATETDRAGRITVEPDLTLPGHPEVFALGDMVTVRGQQLHGVAPVAMQQGRHAARSIAPRLARAVPLPRQGRARDDRPFAGGRRRQRRPRQRLRRLGAVARHPHHVSRRRSRTGCSS